MDKALQLLSLAKKGGGIEAGEQLVGAACRRGKIRLLIVAADAADNTARRAAGWAAAQAIALIRPPFTREQIGAALGKPVCALAGLSDRKLAAAFVRALPDSAQYDGLLAQLERRPGRRYQGEKQLEVAE